FRSSLLASLGPGQNFGNIPPLKARAGVSTPPSIWLSGEAQMCFLHASICSGVMHRKLHRFFGAAPAMPAAPAAVAGVTAAGPAAAPARGTAGTWALTAATPTSSPATASHFPNTLIGTSPGSGWDEEAQISTPRRCVFPHRQGEARALSENGRSSSD